MFTLLHKMHDELHITSMSLVLFLLSHSLSLSTYIHDAQHSARFVFFLVYDCQF